MAEPTIETAGRRASAGRAPLILQLAPAWLEPYLRLARVDRPIGTWLLLLPCWWSTLLADIAEGRTGPDLRLMALFAAGAFLMRGAGCAWNDWVDRDIDGKVERTAGRPIPSGAVTPHGAMLFAAGLSFAALVVLIQLNAFTIVLGAASLLPVVVYPFMKRLTHWPQLILGLTFNWGALVGWSAITGSLGWPAVALYVGAVLWTIGYDTIYAHQDRDDDLAAGLKSTAIRFGGETQRWLAGFYGGAVVLWVVAGWLAGAGVGLAIALAVTAGHFAWQVATLNIDDGGNCLARFKANRDVGFILVLGLLVDLLAG